MVLSLTLMPVLASLGLPRRMSEKETLVDRVAHRLFQPLLRSGLRFPWTTLGCRRLDHRGHDHAGPAPRLGVRPPAQRRHDRHQHHPAGRRQPGRVAGYGTRIEALLKEEFPDEIEAGSGAAVGTAEVATDPMGFEVTDVFITLTPRERWKRAKTQEELVDGMAEVTEKLPGMRAVYSQPIEMRINEMVAGIRADLGIKLFGDDLECSRRRRPRSSGSSSQIPGAADVSDRADHRPAGAPGRGRSGGPVPLRRLGAAGARRRQGRRRIGVGEILEPGRRFPLAVRLPMSYRDDPHALEKILIPTASGQRLPLTGSPASRR